MKKSERKHVRLLKRKDFNFLIVDVEVEVEVEVEV